MSRIRAHSYTLSLYAVGVAGFAAAAYVVAVPELPAVGATPPAVSVPLAPSQSASSSVGAPEVGVSSTPRIVEVGSEPTHRTPTPSRSPSAVPPSLAPAVHPSPVRSSAPHPTVSGGGASAGGVLVAVELLGVSVTLGLLP